MEQKTKQQNSAKKYAIETFLLICPSAGIIGILTKYILGLQGNTFLLNVIFYAIAGMLVLLLMKT